MQYAFELVRNFTSTPPSSDGVALSRFINLLARATSDRLNRPVFLALATYPDIPGFVRIRRGDPSILPEAFRFANITLLESYKCWVGKKRLLHGVAGYIASGYGVCETWKNPKLCDMVEDDKLGSRNIWSVTFTRTSLAVCLMNIIRPDSYDTLCSQTLWDLGYQNWLDNPKDLSFWRKVQSAVGDVYTRSPISTQTL